MNEPSDSTTTPVPKKRRRPRWILLAGGFVIFLIAAALYFGPPIFLEALTEAKKEAAAISARQLVQAVDSYYADNTVLPIPAVTKAVPGGTRLSTDAGEGVELLNILAGNNPRKVKYIAFKEARNKKEGAVYDPAGSRITGLYDPWGNPYLMVIDASYEEKITIPHKIPIFLNGKRCAVYSAGQDGVLETKDDVKTWTAP